MTTPPIDCLLLSTGRAASTATYSYLNAAGGLRLPDNKEPHFWCDIQAHGGIYSFLEQLNVTDPAGYISLYQHSRLSIDGSVGYFFYLREVVERLRSANLQPMVIYLYREPCARAASLFTELKKKGLTHAPDILADLDRHAPPGQWWEYYYDNVDYLENFKLIEAYFDSVIAINYDAFARDPRAAIVRMLEFLEIETGHVADLDLAPINTSVDNIVAGRSEGLRFLSKLLPATMRKRIKAKVTKRMMITRADQTAELAERLPHSVRQYELFRAYINEEDILCLKKSH